MKKITGTAIVGLTFACASIVLGQNAAYAAGLANTGVNGAQNTLLLGIGGGVVVLGAAALIILAVRRRSASKRDDS